MSGGFSIIDQFGNPFRGWLDTVGDELLAEAGRVYTKTLSAAGSVTMLLNGAATASFFLRTAAGNLTVVFEGSTDGTNYDISLTPWDEAAEAYVATSIVVTTTIAKRYIVGVTGLLGVRCRVSAFTSGNLVIAARASQADFIIYGKQFPVIPATVTAAANAGVTLTLAAGGLGLFHYIVGLFISRTSTAALAGTATLVITTTNIPNSLAFSVGNAMIAGATSRDVELAFGVPMKSSVANTATTIVCPVPGAAVLWRINAYYYIGT